MMDNSYKEFVLYKGKKIEVKNGELHLPYQLERFDEIEGLEMLTNLKKLHYDHFNLRKIENLDNLKNLESLTLKSSHHLSKIENIDNLTNLRTLDLTDSNIAKIENLENFSAIIDGLDFILLAMKSFDTILKLLKELNTKLVKSAYVSKSPVLVKEFEILLERAESPNRAIVDNLDDAKKWIGIK